MGDIGDMGDIAGTGGDMGDMGDIGGTGGGTAVLVYTGYYANGQGQLTITLSDKSGEWRVIGHRVDSPVLLTVLTCPHCGEVSKQIAAFCSACGEPME